MDSPAEDQGKILILLLRNLVDELVAVSEEDIAKSVKLIAQEAKLIAEPSSCVGVAAVLGKE